MPPSDQTEQASVAFYSLCQAIQDQPDNIVLHKQFGRWLQKHDPDQLSFDLPAVPELPEVLEVVFQDRHVGHQALARLTGQVLKRRYGIHDGVSPSPQPDVLLQLATDGLVLQWLKLTLNTDIEWEALLRQIRRCLLFDPALAETVLPLTVALAHQCFNNEYIFATAPDERATALKLELSIERALALGDPKRLGATLALLGMYCPLHRLAQAPKIAKLPRHGFPEEVRPMMESLLYEPLDEQRRAETIPSFGTITAPVTLAVREQYEASPYPRWFQLQAPERSLVSWLQKTYDLSLTTYFPTQRLQFLVAGCGTGQEPLNLAASNPKADILAIDISRASLAYSQRMAAKLEIQNVTFLHGDLTSIGQLGQQFHHISCVGVLHHLPHPVDGWQALDQVLLPGGTMKVGVYSRMARLPITFARQEIAKRGLDSSTDHLKQFRDALMHELRYRGLRRAVVNANDFYYTSGFRDLLFHVCEHHYTLTELETTLNQFQLRLLGARLALPDLIIKYLDRFPGDLRVSDFARWRSIEKDYFGTLNLFICWLQKPSVNSAG